MKSHTPHFHLYLKDSGLVRLFEGLAREGELCLQIHTAFDVFSADPPSEFKSIPVSQRDWVFTDMALESVKQFSQRLRSRGFAPDQQLVRMIEHPYGEYFFHDLPVFASVVRPNNTDELFKLLAKLEKAREYARQAGTTTGASSQAAMASAGLEWLNHCEDLQPVLSLVRRVADKSVDVLLSGETGSGKDHLAKYIHLISGRKGQFVHINCPAVPEALLESELFGVEAGAFTGALKQRSGKIEQANNGTLYLDEIDSMSLACQAKLLTALQERGAERLGGNRFIASDFRVVASTKVSLQDAVAAGRFRQDLMYRIQVIQIHLPALRQRSSDIVPLFQFFCGSTADRFNVPAPCLSFQMRQMLMTHDWPGNVRELKAVAERYVLGVPMSGVSMSDATEHRGLRQCLKAYEKSLIISTLKECDGQVADAAKRLGLSLHTLYYRMRTLNISANRLKAAQPESDSSLEAMG